VLGVDDTQWLDAPTASALEYVARRLRQEPVCMLVSLRGEHDDRLPFGLAEAFPADRLFRIGLTGLGLQALYTLLRTRAGLTLPRPVLRRIGTASAGNPFLALEIAHALRREGGFPVAGEPLPVPYNVNELAAQHIHALPASSQEVLAVVAALAQPTLRLVRAATPAAAADGLAKAEESGVIEIRDRRIRFTHPLFAEAVSGAMPVVRRKELHARLAGVVDDVEQQARHLAVAAERRDLHVAASLEAAAVQAEQRGALEAASELWELASSHTPEDQLTLRFTRMANAGSKLFHAGDAIGARGLLASAVSRLPPSRARASARLELADVVFYQGGTQQAVSLCRQALLDAGDDRLLRAVCGVRAAWYGTHDVPGQLTRIEQAAELLRPGDAETHPDLCACVRLMLAYYRFYNGLGLDRDGIVHARSLISAQSLEWTADWARMIWRSVAKFVDLAAARTAYAAEYDLFNAVGDESSLGTLSMHLAEIDCRLGHLQLARHEAERSMEIVEQSGQRRWRGFALYAKGLVDAHLGELDDAHATAAEGLELAAAVEDTWVSAMQLGVLGFIELSRQRHAPASEYFERAEGLIETMGLAEPARHPFHADQLETVVALGDLQRAEALLRRMEQRMEIAPYAYLVAVTHRCQGILLTATGELDAAQAALATALQAHDDLPMPFERARTLLVQGKLLRRRKEKLAARAALLSARQIFDELGSPIWSASAGEELRRLGLRRGTASDLTPTEERVARMAADGMTNREIAAAIFVSPKSVEANLSRVYRKLGISSRRQLARVLREGQL
jgi:DNA-binding CsgD family transcriptional regulator